MNEQNPHVQKPVEQPKPDQKQRMQDAFALGQGIKDPLMVGFLGRKKAGT